MRPGVYKHLNDNNKSRSVTGRKSKSVTAHEISNSIEANDDTGLATYSMILGEQPTTLDKQHDIIRKLGTVVDAKQRNLINKICFNTLFMGEDINWEEVLA